MMIAQHLAFIFVPRAGIEPAWRLIHWCLRPARLPIPPSGHLLKHCLFLDCGCKGTTFFLICKYSAIFFSLFLHFFRNRTLACSA